MTKMKLGIKRSSQTYSDHRRMTMDKTLKQLVSAVETAIRLNEHSHRHISLLKHPHPCGRNPYDGGTDFCWVSHLRKVLFEYVNQ